MNWYEIALKEYEMIRTEVLQSITNQHLIVNYGLSVIGVLLAVAFSKWGEGIIVGVMFLIIIPIVCKLFLNMWTGELNRIFRAGDFLSEKEKLINEKFASDNNNTIEPLVWESWLNGKNSENKVKHTSFHLKSVIVAFFLISTISMLVGCFYFIDFYTLNSVWIYISFILNVYFFYDNYIRLHMIFKKKSIIEQEDEISVSERNLSNVG